MTVNSVMTNLYTDDLERAVAFYRDLLGGTQTFSALEHIELRLGDVILAISSKDAVVREGLPAPVAGNPMELVIWCDSTDDTVATLRAAGAPVLVEPYSGHVSGLRRAYVADPDGNWLAVVSKGDL